MSHINNPDLRPVMVIQGQKGANTVLSGVLDRGDFGYPEAIQFVTWAGAVMDAETSGMVMRLYQDDGSTASATASGMTAVTSGNTSGLTYTTSGQCIALHWDARGAERFIGVVLSVPTTSADTGVIANCFGHTNVPPTAATGSQTRFIGQ